jgi:uncharacterized protein
MSLTENAEVAPGRRTSTTLIDTDVHEEFRSLEELYPYLEPVWRHHLTDPGWIWAGVADNGAYLAPIEAGRHEWMRADGTTEASDFEATSRHLFETEGVTTAILNGFMHFSRMTRDVEFGAALASAYNDWQIEAWLERDPRYRGSVHVHAGLPDLAAREIDRVAEHPGVVQVFLPLDSRQYGDPFYAPIFEAAVRNELPVTLHFGSPTETAIGHPRYFIEWHTLAPPQASMCQLTSILFNGLFDKYEGLKIVLLEAGVSWLPWYMRRADQQYRELRANTPWVKRLPSEHIRDHVRMSTQPMTEVNAQQFTRMVAETGTEHVYMFATDYPHYDADSASILAGLGDELRERIFFRNAVETFPRLAGVTV